MFWGAGRQFVTVTLFISDSTLSLHSALQGTEPVWTLSKVRAASMYTSGAGSCQGCENGVSASIGAAFLANVLISYPGNFCFSRRVDEAVGAAGGVARSLELMGSREGAEATTLGWSAVPGVCPPGLTSVTVQRPSRPGLAGHCGSHAGDYRAVLSM